MVSDASARGGPLTAAEDPRITRVGRILRWTKIDELPQLINVVRGEMSLVGPRPEVRRYVNMFRADYEDILRVRPGITDLASLKYRDESAVLRSAVDPERMYVTRVLPDKIALSREYVGRSSFFFDLSLILKTLVRVAVGERGTPRRKSNEPGKRSLRRVLRTRRGPTPESTPEAAENSKEKDFPI
jgi:lipopolysaccharide/colanic/teichoic acid biosynthesis glycosyltransferase